MAEKCHRNVLVSDSAAVVGYSYVGYAPLLYLNSNGCCSAVNGIFHKLLYYRAWTLDDLACGYKLRKLLIENVHLRHFIHLPLIKKFTR